MESEILFIYNNDSSSRKRARKHVSKVVRRREHRQRSHNPFVHVKVPHSTQDHHTEYRVVPRRHVGHHQPHGCQTDEVSQGLSSQSRLLLRGPAITQTQENTKQERSMVEKFRPQQSTPYYSASPIDSYFSAARSDPFCTLPIVLDPESAKCLDHFNTSMPYLEFCVYEGAPLIPSRHVAFRSALETPAALHAIIATGATHLGSLYGVETSRTIQHHVGEALSLLRTEMLAVSRSNWSRIAQTMTEIAAGDDFRGHIQNSRLHLNGLRELCGGFGGIEKLQGTPKVQLLCCYVLNGSTAAYFPTIRCTRLTFDKLSDTLFHGTSSPEYPKAIDLVGIGIGKAQRKLLLDVSSHVRDFCIFMKRIIPRPEGQLSPSILSLRKILPQYFHTENKLLRRLSIAALDQERFGGLGPKGNHRVSCLFTIVLKLLYLSEAGDLQGIILYLEKLQYLSHPNLRLLQFILMQDGTEVQMDDAAMSWEVVRLMQAYKLLGEEWKRLVNSILVGFLTGDKMEEKDDGYASFESPAKDLFSMKDAMREVLANFVLVIGEKPLLGGVSDMEAAPTENIWEVT